MTDGKYFNEIAGRRRIEQQRHQDPHRRLRQRDQPEQEHRTRAQRFKIEWDVEHQAPRDAIRRHRQSDPRNQAAWPSRTAVPYKAG